MTPSEILIAAKAKIENPENWIKKEFAKDKNNNIVTPIDPAACKFCMLGAIGSITGYADDTKVVDQLVLSIARCYGNSKISVFNDAKKTTHQDVMIVFNDAINLAKAQFN